MTRNRIAVLIATAALGTGSAAAIAACGEDRGGVEVQGGTTGATTTTPTTTTP